MIIITLILFLFIRLNFSQYCLRVTIKIITIVIILETIGLITTIIIIITITIIIIVITKIMSNSNSTKIMHHLQT